MAHAAQSWSKGGVWEANSSQHRRSESFWASIVRQWPGGGAGEKRREAQNKRTTKQRGRCEQTGRISGATAPGSVRAMRHAGAVSETGVWPRSGRRMGPAIFRTGVAHPREYGPREAGGNAARKRRARNRRPHRRSHARRQREVPKAGDPTLADMPTASGRGSGAPPRRRTAQRPGEGGRGTGAIAGELSKKAFPKGKQPQSAEGAAKSAAQSRRRRLFGSGPCPPQ